MNESENLNKTDSEFLSNLKDENRLRSYVIDYIQSNYKTKSSAINFMNRVLNEGCINGIVKNLRYFSQTKRFYQEFKDEIWEVLFELSKEIKTTPLSLIDQLSESKATSADQFENDMAWFGFEETVRQLANDLDIEL